MTGSHFTKKPHAIRLVAIARIAAGLKNNPIARLRRAASPLPGGKEKT
jgi:hypothetical protein